MEAHIAVLYLGEIADVRNPPRQYSLARAFKRLPAVNLSVVDSKQRWIFFILQ